MRVSIQVAQVCAGSACIDSRVIEKVQKKFRLWITKEIKNRVVDNKQALHVTTTTEVEEENHAQNATWR